MTTAAPSCDGVLVDIESTGLPGGDVTTACVADGAGTSAVSLLKELGHRIDYVQRVPGVLCRIDGQPASDACVVMPPADAYWSLWVAKPSGAWQYADVGVTGLSTNKGGGIAFIWHQGSGKETPPNVVLAAPTHAASPSVSPHTSPTASASPGLAPSHTATTSASDATTTSAPASPPTGDPNAMASWSATAIPTETAVGIPISGTAGSGVAPAAQTTSSHTSAIVSAVVVVVLVALAATVWVRRFLAHRKQGRG